MAAPTSTFEIRLLRRDAGESWTDEALVIIGGRDRLATLGDYATWTWIGRRPAKVIGPTSSLLATDEPHDAFVARCSCGEEGCNTLIASIRRVGDRVVWDQIRRGSDARAEEFPIETEPFEFDAQQYEDAILHPGVPLTAWSPTTRQAAHLVNQKMSGADLEVHRLRVSGCSDRGDNQVEVHAVLGRTGDEDRAILKARFTLNEGESAEALADRVTAYLTSGAMVTDPLATRRPIGPGRPDS
jgi:hypothetical protein